MYKLILAILIPIFLIGCSSIEEIPIIDKVTQPDYVSSKKAKKLEVPPDLDDVNSSNKYTINGQPTSLKQYQNKDKEDNLVNILDEKEEKIKVVKSGSMRWLIVPAKQGEVWPVVENFWEEMGFDVSSSKRTGIIETKWIAESDLKKDEGTLGKFDAWLDALANTGTRRKFRTRIEDGVENGTTEIYLSQRSLLKGLSEHRSRKAKHFDNTVNPDTVYRIQEYKPSGDEEEEVMVSNFKEDDLEIQYELLRRLMVKLGTTDLKARESLDKAIEIKNAELVNQDGYNYIKLNDNYSRAWRRLNLAIDMVGFLVEDKNRSDGIFYIKYSNLEIDEDGKSPKKKKGLISKLAFWQDDDTDIEEDPEGQEMYRKEIEGEDQDEASLEKSDKKWSEKTWEEKFPFFANWGDDDEENVPEGEKRFRVRIVEIDDGAKVFIDYPNESLNKTKTAQSIINILYDYLKT
ncbi:NlpBDapX lipoprotein [beta proteobacterium KB13]|uniref:NlpBDapX lipoprotein n=1 Tax=beta proteobacterium KB13 TaxID=314607 RepID=B6BWH9_9PROT|nr:NlpBDapX lipoprotein [beta proteobacterium KB13]